MGSTALRCGSLGGGGEFTGAAWNSTLASRGLPATKDFQLAHEGIGLDPEKDHIDMSTCTVIFCIAFQLLQCYNVGAQGLQCYFPNAKAEMERTLHSAVCYCLPGHPCLPGTPGGKGEASCKASSGTIRGRESPGEWGKQPGALLIDAPHHLCRGLIFPLHEDFMSVKFF